MLLLLLIIVITILLFENTTESFKMVKKEIEYVDYYPMTKYTNFLIYNNYSGDYMNEELIKFTSILKKIY